MTLYEPDVVLTDFALTIECGLFAIWLRGVGHGDVTLRRMFIALFAAIGVASLLGGISHGFLADKQSLLFRVAWTSTLVAIGCAAFVCWAAGARLWLSENAVARVTQFAGALLTAYLVIVLFVSQTFVVAVIHYLPAAMFLLVSFVMARRQVRARHLEAGILGLLLTFVAAGIQQGRVELHPVYFNADALYHLVAGHRPPADLHRRSRRIACGTASVTLTLLLRGAFLEQS